MSVERALLLEYSQDAEQILELMRYFIPESMGEVFVQEAQKRHESCNLAAQINTMQMLVVMAYESAKYLDGTTSKASQIIVISDVLQAIIAQNEKLISYVDFHLSLRELDLSPKDLENIDVLRGKYHILNTDFDAPHDVTPLDIGHRHRIMPN